MRKTVSILFALVLALGLCLMTAVPVSAAVTVTPAGGGGAISADTTGGAWTTLGAITISEGAVGDVAVGVFVLTIPAGFEFNTGSIPDVVTTGTTPELVANTPAVIAATTITVTVTTASTTETDNDLIIGGVTPIQVRPTAGTPLAGGNINMTAGTIAGVDGATNFGTLAEVHGAATQFVIINPVDGTVDAAITVTVRLQDQYGNTVTTGGDKDKDVTLNADGSATGDGVVDVANGVGTKAISDTVAETVNLSLTDHVPTGFTCTSTQNVVFAHGVATQLVFTQQPAGSVSGVALTTQPIVEARDQFGNVDTTYAVNVVASENEPGALTGTTTIAPVLGVATFTDLVYTATASPETFQIDVASGALTGATSNDVICTVPSGGGGGMPTNSGEGSMSLTPYLNGQGEAICNINLTSTNGLVTINILFGTLVLNAQGNPLVDIQIVVLSTPPPPPGYVLVGHAYDCLPAGATFQPTIILTFKYAEADIPAGVSEQDLVLAYWDGDQWVSLPTTINAANNTATARVAHFTPFAILASTGTAAFGASDLSITPVEVDIGQEVTISVLVANTGDAAGNYEVTLDIDNVVVVTKAVTLAAGTSERVTFTTAKDVAGTYAVSVGDLSGTFVVKQAAPPALPPEEAPPEAEESQPLNIWIVVGIIVAVIVVVLAVVMLVRGRRRV